MKSLVMLNEAVALDRVGGDATLLQEVAQLFLEDYPNSLTAIEAALRSQDPKALERAAHTLKGAVANFGVDPVVQSALALEMAGRNGDLSGCDSKLQDLKAKLAVLHQDLAVVSHA